LAFSAGEGLPKSNPAHHNSIPLFSVNGYFYLYQLFAKTL
jgi:hypothetical protein